MKSKLFYICSECGYKTTKWMGKCPSCQAWNTLEEEVEEEDVRTQPSARKTSILMGNNEPEGLDDLSLPNYMRFETGMQELNRVLGGGLVHGSVVLLAGEPGIGKSTLLLQISSCLAKEKKVFYISGEESGGQIKLRAKRLGVHGANLIILTETAMDRILAQIDKVKPDILIIDSIQTMYHDQINSAPGSMTQIRECAMSFIAKAKGEGISTFLVGHVNKEGGIAGPKVLEHMVDAVLQFEGERQQSYRIIRAIKNRFGSTNEIGVFEMTDTGLAEVANPSEMLLAGRPKNISGNCALSTLEGTRTLIAEVQALVAPTGFPSPRRTANGIDYNRLNLILAVLERRLGLRFSQNDVYMNIIGGLHIDEPAADMAIATSLISAITNRIVPDDLIAVGELGLAGECRAVANLEQRVREAARLGFSKAIIPFRNIEKRPFRIDSIQLIPVKGIYEILPYLSQAEE